MKIGRNDPCPCGSGKKYKHCCYEKDSVKHELPPEPEVVEDEAQSDEELADAHDHKKQTSHHKDRSRFQGETRGSSSTFRPRATRGAQRGS